MSKQQGASKLSKSEKKKISSQLCEMFRQVNPQVISRIVGSCSSFDEALERTLQVAEKKSDDDHNKHQEKEEAKEEANLKKEEDQVFDDAALASLFPSSSSAQRGRALALSAGCAELAVDLMASLAKEDDDNEHENANALARSVADLCEVFALSPSQARAELLASQNRFEEAAMNILRRSKHEDHETKEHEGGSSSSSNSKSADIAFLRAMFPRESEDILQGLLEEMKQLEDVVDFLLSLDVLLLEEAMSVPDSVSEEPQPAGEEEVLAEMFPQLDADARLAALEACSWDVNEACAVLSAAQQVQQPKKKIGKSSKRWQKLEAKQIRVGASSRWNGSNAIVRECLVESKVSLIEPARTEIEAPVFPSVVFEESSGRKGAYESHVFTQGRYVASTIRASDLEDDSAVAKVAQLHQQNRRRYAYLAANAYKAGDAQAAKKFSQLAEKEERLQTMWSSRITGQTRKVDLHGFFVKEALQICRNVLGGCGAGESITFVTGRGAHSEGGVPRIRNALVSMLDGMSDTCSYRVNVGEVVVKIK